MCMFSGPVEDVSNTMIFARRQNGRQFLVYRMTVAATSDLAMVLPLPVPPNPSEDAVRFINLEDYGTFFDDLRYGFPIPMSLAAACDSSVDLRGMSVLEVLEVGKFEASFVPRLADFTRLDARFRMSDEVWSKLPSYHDYGFAVFKLKRSAHQHDVHPMAFEFPTRLPNSLYFPTLHVHDGSVPSRAGFDHMLYCQGAVELDSTARQDWQQSHSLASEFMDVARSAGIIDESLPCWRQPLYGSLLNQDTLVGTK